MEQSAVITKEQMRLMLKAKNRFYVRCALTGVNTGLLSLAMIMVATLAIDTYLNDSTVLHIVSGALIGFFNFNRMFSVLEHHYDILVSELKSILNQQ